MQRAIFGVMVLSVALGCNSTPEPPTAPTPPPPPPTGTNPSPTPPPLTATVVIGSNNSFVPLEVTIAVGGRVTFNNQSNRAFDISSDPPHVHTDCPAVMEVGFIQPGQIKQTGPLTVVRTCGFHDHMNENNPDLRGRIIVQ